MKALKVHVHNILLELLVSYMFNCYNFLRGNLKKNKYSNKVPYMLMLFRSLLGKAKIMANKNAFFLVINESIIKKCYQMKTK